MAEGEKIIGIDLGTTNSVVSRDGRGEPTVIPNQEREPTDPFGGRIHEQREVLVGEPASARPSLNPKGTIYSIKRFMGRRHKEVARPRRRWSPTRSSAGPTTSSKSRSREGVHPAGDLGLRAPQAEGGRREPPRAQGP